VTTFMRRFVDLGCRLAWPAWTLALLAWLFGADEWYWPTHAVMNLCMSLLIGATYRQITDTGHSL
jgi:hypothetical protein